MLLVKTNPQKNTRFLKKNPFFLFFKGPSFLKLKKSSNIVESTFIRKKYRILEYFITPKARLPSYDVLTDGYTRYTEPTETSLWFCPNTQKNSNLFYNNNGFCYFSSYYKFLLECNLMGVVFFKCFDATTGKILYRPGSGSFITVHQVNIGLGFLIIRLPSGFKKKLPLFSAGIIGRSSGVLSTFVFRGKFKFSNKKKSVRGIAMNPVDHPNGGRSNVKKPFMTVYGKVAKFGK